jgi:hypothetical protein
MAAEVLGRDPVNGTKLGQATSHKLGFYGATAVSQPSSTFATSAVGTASSADVTTGQKAALIAIMNTLSALGIWPAQA